MDFMHDTLINWYAQNRRDLPWRHDPTPYEVWLSEVILQQTRVSQGRDYYLRFIERWPTVADLAQATEEEVLKMWQGLGYYSRARNLHHCAQQVVEQHGGQFPADFEQLKRLKGIGDYTAAAIASIAFGLPHAVVDGNVYRVLSRLYDIDTPININEGQKCFAHLADELLDRDHPGLHNQAMMEFGALQCTPQNPDCLQCPLQAHCLAFVNNTVAQRPVKVNRVNVKTRYFNYFVIRFEDKIYLHKRDDSDIWKNLYDFPCIETQGFTWAADLLESDEFDQLIEHKPYFTGRTSPLYTHKLTHRTIIAQFIEINLEEELLQIQTKGLTLTRESDLGNYPIPRLIDLYLNT
jgi:A/G-specific adenine glycosylase